MLDWKHFDNDITGPASFDSDRWQAAANLTGYWYRDAWRYSPAETSSRSPFEIPMRWPVAPIARRRSSSSKT